MARPKKEGINYFSFDTNIFSDRKIRKLLKHHATKGFTVFSFVLCEIYRDKGYFIECDNDFVFDVADRLNLKEGTVKEIIQFCVINGLFDKGVYDVSGVLTSDSIKKRYAMSKRISHEELDIGTGQGVFTAKTPVSATETPVIAVESTQSKRKKRKNKQKELLPVGVECVFSEGENPKDRERTVKTESSSQDADILEIANAEPLEKLEELVGYLKRRFHLKNDTDIKGFVCSHARQDKEFYERFKHSVKEFFTYHDTVKTKTRYVMNWSSFKEKWDLEDYGKKLEEHQRSNPVQTKQEMIYHATML